MKKCVFFFLQFCLIQASLWSQISIGDQSFSYVENFDGLASTGGTATWTNSSTINGWYSNLGGYRIGSGTNGLAGQYSYGATNATERALGSLASGVAIPAFGVRLINNTGSVITSLSIAFTGEQWRRGSGPINTLYCSYQIAPTVTSVTTGTWTNVAALNFSSPVTTGMNRSLDGNLGANQTSVAAVLMITLPVGEEIMLRWSDENTNGSDDGLAIDNLTINTSTLPIALTKFQAFKGLDHTVDLLFSTASEYNNALFAIERAVDGKNFSEIGQLPGAGNSLMPKNYVYTDHDPIKGLNYYRLKQVGFDGTYAYSRVVSAAMGKAENLSLFPSPATDRIRLLSEEPIEENGLYEVFDKLGRLVLSGALDMETKEQEIDLGPLTAGTYLLRSTAGQSINVILFQKQ